MIDTPVFGFFHRARPLPTVASAPMRAKMPDAVAGHDDEYHASVVRADLPVRIFPDHGQPATLDQQPPSPPVSEHATPKQKMLSRRFAAPSCAAEVFTKAGVSAALGADQLGLAHPLVITLIARLEGAGALELDACAAGIYRPIGFRAAPWSGFAYDEADDARIGLAAGTRILTARGEVEVERLLPGDTALALRGPALLPIAWIGRTVTAEDPVCIDAGALGPNLPRRSLCVAADQPIFLAAMPVAARTLLNGSTIRTAECEGIDMFHIDVGRCEILFAEGLPLSSWERAQQQRDTAPASL